MNAATYLARELASKRLTHSHLVTAVRAFQQAHGLLADGKPGPKTCAAMARLLAPPAADHGGSTLGLAALEVAKAEIGNGEERQNNDGPHVARYHGKKDDKLPDGNWCAAFVGYCYEQAAKKLDRKLPFKRTGGAKLLGKRAAKAGIKVAVEDIQPGDILWWDRGKRGDWKGHIEIAATAIDPATGVVHTVAGNTGRFPAKVRYRTHDLLHDDRFEGAARLPDEEATT